MASERIRNSVAGGLSATASVAGDAYVSTLNWKNNSEFSNWLTDHLSNQYATVASKAMDAEYLRTHIGGGWHRLYDGAPVAGRLLEAFGNTVEIVVADGFARLAHDHGSFMGPACLVGAGVADSGEL